MDWVVGGPFLVAYLMISITNIVVPGCVTISRRLVPHGPLYKETPAASGPDEECCTERTECLKTSTLSVAYRMLSEQVLSIVELPSASVAHSSDIK